MKGGRRGFVGAVERAWSGAGGAFPWTLALLPAAGLYGIAAAGARSRAAGRRRGIPGMYVVAVGGLTVGGSGKSSVARWLAGEVLARTGRPALLLRGHRARRVARGGPFVVPDFEAYPLREAADRAGDEAAAHRASLPRGATVAVDRDRFRAARVAGSGYGSGVAVLDDGWEQDTLRWDELWVALDPERPAGNGAILPAGPMRRPASTLRDAAAICFVLEDGASVPSETIAWVRSHAPGASILRFRRRLIEAGCATAEPAALVSGVASPRRLERFALAAGHRVVFHADFPDHARWTASAVRAACRQAAEAGARCILITEKDEPRWPPGAGGPLPVLVLKTMLEAIDPVGFPLERIGAAVARPGPIG